MFNSVIIFAAGLTGVVAGAVQAIDEGPLTRAAFVDATAIVERAAAASPSTEAARLWVVASRGHQQRGLLSSNDDDAIRWYARGAAAATRALQANASAAGAHTWRAANNASLASRAPTKGALLLGSIFSDLKRALRIDPNDHLARSILARVHFGAPALLGGSDDAGEALLTDCLDQDPQYTACRVALADHAAAEGKPQEALRQYTAVLEEERPTRRHDWARYDCRRAAKALRVAGRAVDATRCRPDRSERR